MVGDILMFRTRRALRARLIQQGTHSYWNHCALVFNTSDVMIIGCPLIVEASYGGIEIHQLNFYTDHFDQYDIGVMRESDFSPKERAEIVKTFILNELDTPYDYHRLVGHYFGRLIGKISIPLQIEFQKLFVRSDAYLCSTFVHMAVHNFHDGVHDAPDDTPDDDYLRSEEMYTPGDLASDPNLTWIFNKQV